MAGDVEKSLRKCLKRTEEEIDKLAPGVEIASAFADLRDAVDQFLEERFPPLKRTPSEWATALLHVADQDRRAAFQLAGDGDLASVWCMLLQMAIEKYAKAALARADAQFFRKHIRSHAVTNRFLAVLERHRAQLRFSDYEFKAAKRYVAALEALHPALAKNGPHLEYPWADEKQVYVPSALPLVQQLADPKSLYALTLVRFVRNLHDHFDSMF